MRLPCCIFWANLTPFSLQLHSDDGRLLFVGWWNVGLSCLTAPREVAYDRTLQRLRALPIRELHGLREGSLGSHTAPIALDVKVVLTPPCIFYMEDHE